MKQKILVIIIAATSLVATLWPLLRLQFFHLHDWTHVARLVEMDLAIRDGHFPVRWSANLGYGYGLPQFNFYAPLPYYIAWVFYALGTTAIWAIKCLIMLNFAVSFWVMYKMVKHYWGWEAGLIGATAFTFAPYRAVDTYVRGALGELTAITFIALSWWMIIKLSEKFRLERMAMTSLALAGLVLAHNLVSFLALPWLFLGGLILSVGKNFRKRFWILLGTFILAAGISAFYALPALVEKKYTQVDQLTTGFSDYHHHFLYLRQFFLLDWAYGGSIGGPEDDIAFGLGWVSIILSAFGLALISISRRQWGKEQAMILAAGITLFISIFMSTFKATLIWENLPLFKYVQFPWRYLSLIIVFLSVLVGAGSKRLFGWLPKFKFGLMIILILGLSWPHLAFFRPESYLENNEALYYTDPKRIAAEMSKVIPDFLPLKANSKRTQPPIKRVDFLPQTVKHQVLIDRTQEFYVTANLNQKTTLIVMTNYFPGWKLFLNGKPLSFIVNAEGLMEAEINQIGDVQISGKFTDTPNRTIANITSLMAIAFTISIWLPSRKKLSFGI